MILFDGVFGWRFEVKWKDGIDKVLSWNNIEVVSNVDRPKWEKSDESEEALLIHKEEVSKLLWVISSGV